MASDDLLEHFRLRAEVLPEHTLHWSFISNRRHGTRERVEKRWNRVQSLGEGGFGQVWQESCGLADGSQEFRAVKVVKKQQMKKYRIDFRKEILALAKFSKEEYKQEDILVTFFGWFETDRLVFLAMEYFEHGDLARHIHDVTSEDHVRQITTNLLEGLKIMHGEGFAHRDLKPLNVFVAEKPPVSPRWWVKIGDFGISKRVQNEETAYRTQVGSALFQAPEVHGFITSHDETDEYDNSVDIWSLGCVVYNISAHCVPFPNRTEINRFCQQHTTLIERPLQRTLSQAGIEFVQRLLIPEPTQRMTIACALADPWLVNITKSTATEQTLGLNDLHTFFSGHMSEAESRNAVESLATDVNQGTNIPLTGEMQDVQTTSKIEQSTRTTSTYESPLRTVSQLAKSYDSIYRPQTQDDTTPDLDRNRYEDSDNSILTTSKHAMPGSASVSTDDYWKQSVTLKRGFWEIRAITFHPTDAIIALNHRSFVRLLNLNTQQTVCEFWCEKTIQTIAFSPQGEMMAAGFAYTIRVWDMTTKKVITDLEGHKAPVLTVVFSPDGKLIASNSGKRIKIWEAATGKCLQDHLCQIKKVQAISFSSDGKAFSTLYEDMSVDITPIENGSMFESHSRDLTGFRTFAMSPGRELIAGGKGNTLLVFNVLEEKPLYELSDQKVPVSALAFSPAGNLLASAFEDGSIRIRIATTGSLVCMLSSHVSHVFVVVFSPDGKRLASCSRDMTVRIWGVDTTSDRFQPRRKHTIDSS